MAKIVETQYRENYGAHDWDGTGECPQYWKNKFGSTYVFINAEDHDIHSVIGHANDYSQEYIISIRDTKINKGGKSIFDEWSERIFYTKAENGEWLLERLSSEDFSGTRGLKSYIHRFEYANAKAIRNNEPSKHEVRYEFKNGMTANSEEEALKIIEHLESRVMA